MQEEMLSPPQPLTLQPNPEMAKVLLFPDGTGCRILIRFCRERCSTGCRGYDHFWGRPLPRMRHAYEHFRYVLVLFNPIKDGIVNDSGCYITCLIWHRL
jgi:hypothetical protein